jgi:LPXTG-motif cell wall-anchored protein
MSRLAALASFLILAASTAWAQTPPAGTPPATDTATGGIGDYWWIIVLIIIVVAAIWYFSRRNRSV